MYRLEVPDLQRRPCLLMQQDLSYCIWQAYADLIWHQNVFIDGLLGSVASEIRGYHTARDSKSRAALAALDALQSIELGPPPDTSATAALRAELGAAVAQLQGDTSSAAASHTLVVDHDLLDDGVERVIESLRALDASAEPRLAEASTESLKAHTLLKEVSSGVSKAGARLEELAATIDAASLRWWPLAEHRAAERDGWARELEELRSRAHSLGDAPDLGLAARELEAAAAAAKDRWARLPGLDLPDTEAAIWPSTRSSAKLFVYSASQASQCRIQGALVPGSLSALQAGLRGNLASSLERVQAWTPEAGLEAGAQRVKSGLEAQRAELWQTLNEAFPFDLSTLEQVACLAKADETLDSAVGELEELTSRLAQRLYMLTGVWHQ